VIVIVLLGAVIVLFGAVIVLLGAVIVLLGAVIVLLGAVSMIVEILCNVGQYRYFCYMHKFEINSVVIQFVNLGEIETRIPWKGF
jgi:hypothetical protein